MTESAIALGQPRTASYCPLPGVPDEMVAPDGRIRPSRLAFIRGKTASITRGVSFVPGGGLIRISVLAVN